jgi:hypothetical protein
LKQPKEITDLQKAILAIHGYKALYSRTVSVREVLDEGVVWDGLVRVFALPECPKAKHCFAWRFTSGGQSKKFATASRRLQAYFILRLEQVRFGPG